ncbi:MAG: hypothetical protein K0R71_363 [Bacillales bacterium]|jgi:tetratricopeptide (TPR) repeat protein|nr:hypothetical protein [Bacillales bacterium]
MDIDFIISNLKNSKMSNFDEFSPVFRNYERILHRAIKNDPNNYKAISLLAMIKCELRKSTNISLKYLENAFYKNKNYLSDYDFSLLSTNLAYFYAEECTNKELVIEELLQSAISRESQFHQTYYALALHYFKQNKYRLALPLFEKAENIFPLYIYKFNHAICLYKCGQIPESIKILEKLSINYGKHEYHARAYYTCGVLYASLGNSIATRSIAYDLLNIDYTSLNIDHCEIADLMFLVGEYEICIELYNKTRLYDTADWLGIYFFSFKMINRGKVALEKLDNVTCDIENEIAGSTLEDFNGSKRDFNYYLESEGERLKNIKTVYNNIFTNEVKPKVSDNIDLLYACYYINCPRHLKEDIQNTLIQ